MSRDTVAVKPCPDVDPASYRIPQPVTAVRCYSACPHLFTYPICPRCGLTMEREYQRFCDHCGQALDWKGLSKAVVVLAHPSNGAR
jgi:predicted amidophosphoribosyltransferase